jgi:Mg-chelatase subunit ChlI
MTQLPFSAVVGQDDAKLALLLAAIDPRLGGVLLRGQKGSAKTTLARGLAQLLPGESPFVELPLGATEDRVLGSLDLTELLSTGTPRYRPGLLAAAHGGVLYVDEINLLADHLVDVLLDVAVTGVNRVEREGVSHTHPARFVLVASMNPEEGTCAPSSSTGSGSRSTCSPPSTSPTVPRRSRRSSPRTPSRRSSPPTSTRTATCAGASPRCRRRPSRTR